MMNSLFRETRLYPGQTPDLTTFVYKLALASGNGPVQRESFENALYPGEDPKPQNTETPKPSEEIKEREKQAWARGVQEGESRKRAEFDRNLTEQRRKIGETMERFGQERENYFAKAEEEVVRLALAIAEKVLHREAHMDPMLLRGAVRVAIEKVSAATELKLCVPPAEMEQWQEFLRNSEHSHRGIQLVGDPALESGGCLLKTTLGETDLSWKTQFKEIEQGFYDLLALRPKGQP